MRTVYFAFAVLLSWAWSYVTYDRGARLITGPLPNRNRDRDLDQDRDRAGQASPESLARP